MAYIGNDIRVGSTIYRQIDDISSSFNGTTTSFALRVGGATPVPFPLNPQQCLISVGGVPQKPDTTGADGFTFSGSNIVFSSAPVAGEVFWGIILAGSDYLSAGGAFPDGTASVPSITFSSNTTTGLYLVGTNVLGITTGGVSRGAVDSSGRFLLGTGSDSSGARLQVSGDMSLNGATSGYTKLKSADAASNNTVTVPSGTGTMPLMTLATAQATTSGTSIDFTGIPSWVKRVTVMFNGVSTNGANNVQIQLGTSSGVETSSYVGVTSYCGTGGYGAASFSSGFGFYGDGGAVSTRYGSIVLTTMGNNIWEISGSPTATGGGATFTMTLAGQKALSATLDRVRITSVGSADTFDAGSVNILYEG